MVQKVVRWPVKKLAGGVTSLICLNHFGGLSILLHYDYDPKDYNINSMPVVMVVTF